MALAEGLLPRRIDSGVRLWAAPAVLTLVTLAAVVLLFRPTFLGLASVWWHSPTYSYGLIVVPIVLVLVGERWRELAALTPGPTWRALPPLLAAGLIWLLGQILALAWLAQAGAIGLLILSVWALLGSAAFRVLLLPLSLLFLAIPPVPLHDALMRPLMDWTGDIAVTLLGWSDISYTRRGDLISLATGNWSVEKVCSGIRFFFTSAVLGIVFAAWAFRSWPRRLLFIAFALVLPVLANGARVYVTILVGHLDGVAEAISVDHTVYGGLFGGLVLTVMFVVGAMFRERDPATASGEPSRPGKPVATDAVRIGIRAALAAAACLLIAASWPPLAGAIDTPSPQRSMLPLSPPPGADGWRHNRQRLWMWWPRVGRVDGEFYGFYQKSGKTVALYVGQSLAREAGAELTDPNNVMIVKQHDDWRAHRRQRSLRVELNRGAIDVIQNRLPALGLVQGGMQDLVIWQWYRVAGRYTANPHLARLLGLWSSLVEGRPDIALIVVATPYDKDPTQGDALLAGFLESMLPEIEALLDSSRRGGAAQTTALPR